MQSFPADCIFGLDHVWKQLKKKGYIVFTVKFLYEYCNCISMTLKTKFIQLEIRITRIYTPDFLLSIYVLKATTILSIFFPVHQNFLWYQDGSVVATHGERMADGIAKTGNFSSRRHPEFQASIQTEAAFQQRFDQSCRDYRSMDTDRRHQHRYGSPLFSWPPIFPMPV